MKPGQYAMIRVMMLVTAHGRRQPSACTTHFDLDSAITAARRLRRSPYRGRYAVWIEHVDAPATKAAARMP